LTRIKKEKEAELGKLSLSMIVKNEEKYLRDCLESVKGVVDEIVLVDTGSSDETIKIAEEFGAKIFHFKWINDFSAARNFSLSKCSGDWILYLDADERLDKESIKRVNEIKATNKLHGVYCSLYNVDEINNKPKLQKYTRLFKNSPGIYFTGRAHEQIENSLIKKKYALVNSDITITHLGYNVSRTELKNKASRNLNLLLEDYKNVKNSYTAFQLGNTYSILGDVTKAAEYYLLAMKDSQLSKVYYAIGAAYVAEYYVKNNNLQEALAILEKGLKKNPDYPLLNFVGSEIQFKIGNGELAIQMCIKASELNKKMSQEKKSNNVLDVIIDRDNIIYHGLNLAVKKNINSGISYFLDELGGTFTNKAYTFDEETSIIVSLANNSLLEKHQIEILLKIINDSNLEFYLELLGRYELYEEKYTMLEKFIEKYPDKIILYNKLGLALSKGGKTHDAIEVLESTFNKVTDDPTPVFYLISLYVETNELSKLKNLIETSKKKYSKDMVFLANLKRIEDKVQKILQKQ